MASHKQLQIVVTGGGGYAGCLLVPALLNRRHKVRVIDNMMYGTEALFAHVGNNSLEIIRADIRNDISAYLKDADVVYHLAGISGFPACADNPSAAKEINVAATRRLVKSLSPGQLIIYASTTAFYGDSPSICDETAVPRPVSLYGQTKYKAEQIVMERDNSVALRFATLFGVSPRMRTDLLVNDFVRRAIYERYLVLFEAATKRTFLHVRDAVRGYLWALDQADKMRNNVFNVGSESLNFSKAEIAEAVRKRTECVVTSVAMDDFDVRNFETSFAKITALGFKPRFTLEAGIDELAKLYGFYQPYPTFRTI